MFLFNCLSMFSAEFVLFCDTNSMFNRSTCIDFIPITLIPHIHTVCIRTLIPVISALKRNVLRLKFKGNIGFSYTNLIPTYLVSSCSSNISDFPLTFCWTRSGTQCKTIWCLFGSWNAMITTWNVYQLTTATQ